MKTGLAAFGVLSLLALGVSAGWTLSGWAGVTGVVGFIVGAAVGTVAGWIRAERDFVSIFGWW